MLTSCLRQCEQPRAGNAEKTVTKILGPTMGTTYSVVLVNKGQSFDEKVLKAKIEKRLAKVIQIFSTYEKDSTISRFNRANVGEKFKVEPEFLLVVKEALKIHQQSQGAFNIALDPLIDLWGFDKSGRKKSPPTSEEFLLAKAKTDLAKLELGPDFLQKNLDGLAINLSGIAKGYGVDEIARLLEQENLHNFLVEIGGEIVARGTNAQNESWRLGIENPHFIGDLNKVLARVRLENMALASSGSYLNFFTDEKNESFHHILDPRTGAPAKSDIISVSVIAKSCMQADAFATAALVLGFDALSKLAPSLPGLSFMVVRKAQEKWLVDYLNSFEDLLN